jgi:hypothetical protein
VQILSAYSDPSALESFLGLSAAAAGEVSLKVLILFYVLVVLCHL